MYWFILGKDRDLSLAELSAVYPPSAMKAQGPDWVKMELEAFASVDLNRLGGVVKVARFLASASASDLNQILFEILNARYAGHKLTYGISLYEAPRLQLRLVLSRLKKTLKEADIKSRFVNQDYQNLSSAHSKGLAKEGIELIVAGDKDQLWIGEVVAAQDIDAYSHRDYEKPYRNMKVGMLPPKLAQVLINLTGVKPGGRIWDPFCGTGTLVMEGMLMGHRMLGSDVNEKMIFASQQNAEWLKKEFDVKVEAEFFPHDATQPLKKPFDAIACEGYLGPPQGRMLSTTQLRPIEASLEKLYVDFFRALHAVKFRGPIVIALPFFRTSEGREVFLDGAIRDIEKLGFKRTPLLPHSLFLQYARPDQVVGRAIYRFQS